MEIAQVIGTAVATEKEPRLHGSKLLLVKTADEFGKVSGTAFIAQDMVGAGTEELVLVVRGSTARIAAGSADIPVDAAIVGILDSLSVADKTTYRK